MSTVTRSTQTPHTVRIVVADADGEARTLYRTSLTGQGWDVVEASDGREALVKALSYRPALIITETRLPHFDGFELCAILRRDAVTRSVPILVVTTELRGSELRRVRDAGADAVLTKPVDLEAVLREIKRLLKAAARGSDWPVEAAPSPGRPRATQVRAHVRVETTTPPVRPPELRCPLCDRPLHHERSNLGGVNRRFAEQWDTYTCAGSCGTFEYRHRTRKLRRVA